MEMSYLLDFHSDGTNFHSNGLDFHFKCLRTRAHWICQLTEVPRSAGASAGHASVAGTAEGHDGSAGSAAVGVAHVVRGLYGVGGMMVDAAILGEGVRFSYRLSLRMIPAA